MILNMKTMTMTKKGQISIPKVARDAMGVKEGDKLVAIFKEDQMILRPLKTLKNKINPGETAILSEKSLAKDWLSEEDEKAWAYLQKEM